jgi:hypothetical protein
MEEKIISKDKSDKNWFNNIFNSPIIQNLSFSLSIISFFALLAGCLAYNVSPLYTLQQVGYQQQHEMYQQQENLKNNFTKFHNDLGTKFLHFKEINAAKNEFNQVVKVDPLNQTAH